jgi:UDP-glucuronate decarboxylase
MDKSMLLSTDIDEIVDTQTGTFWGQFAGKRILLTGGCGFLGRYFTEVFIRLNERVFAPAGWKPCELVVLDNFITAGAFGSNVQNRPGVSFVTHDIIQPFVPERPFDFVLHAAGIASPAWYRKHPIETYQVAVKGTENALEIARRSGPSCRVLYFSSSEIYGDPDAAHVPTREDYKGHVACLGPRACYDSSKRMAETVVEIYAQKHGVQASIVRPFNFYGPGMQRQDYRVLPNFAARWVDGEPLHVYGTGQQTRTFCYVNDGIRGCLQVLANGKPGQPYNIGNPEPEISMRDLALLVGKVTGAEVKFETVDHPETYPADEPQRRCPDIGKSREHVGYEPKVDLEVGLRRFFWWAHGAYRAKAEAA